MTKLNILIYVLSFLLLLADWAQTRQIAKNPDKWFETNKLLGVHPSVSRVDTYFAVVLAGYTVVYLALVKYVPPTAFLCGAIVAAIEAYVVYNNNKLGIPFFDDQHPD